MIGRTSRASALAAALLSAGPALAVDESFETEGPAIHVRTVASGLDHPWALAFLSSAALITLCALAARI